MQSIKNQTVEKAHFNVFRNREQIQYHDLKLNTSLRCCYQFDKNKLQGTIKPNKLQQKKSYCNIFNLILENSKEQYDTYSFQFVATQTAK